MSTLMVFDFTITNMRSISTFASLSKVPVCLLGFFLVPFCLGCAHGQKLRIGGAAFCQIIFSISASFLSLVLCGPVPLVFTLCNQEIFAARRTIGLAIVSAVIFVLWVPLFWCLFFALAARPTWNLSIGNVTAWAGLTSEIRFASRGLGLWSRNDWSECCEHD